MLTGNQKVKSIAFKRLSDPSTLGRRGLRQSPLAQGRSSCLSKDSLHDLSRSQRILIEQVL
jgi:hypothetical protein